MLTRRHVLQLSGLGLSARLLSAIPLDKIQLGVTTDEIDEDVAVAARFLKDFGLHWAEVRSIWGKYNTSQPVEKVREAKAIFEQNGVRTSVLGSSFFKVPIPADNATLDNQFALLDLAMERAAVLGTDKIRTFAFTYEKGQTSGDARTYGRIYELVTEAAKRAKARKMRLAVENVGGSYVATGAESAELLKNVKADNLGLTWDPNNAALSGEKDSYPAGFAKLDPARIFHVHLRDFKNGQWCAVGEGDMDNLGQIRALLKSGYKGSFTLETHYKSQQGKAHATRTSLTALLKVIEKV